MVDSYTITRRVIPDEPTRIDRAAFLAACRAKGCVTDEDRSRLLGMPRRSVSRYLNSEFEPRLTTARWIASRLDTTVDELWPAA